MAIVEDFLYKGSPFLPEIEQEVVNYVVNDLRGDPSYYPGEVIAKRLGQVASLQAAIVLGELGQLHKRFGMMPPDVAQYLLGFDNPLLILHFAYIGAVEGLAGASRMLSELDVKEEKKLFLSKNLGSAVGILRQDPSGRMFINTFVVQEFVAQEDTFGNIYYRIGLEAARRTFNAYSDFIDAKLSSTGYRVNPFPPQEISDTNHGGGDMTIESDDISRQMDFALDKLFSATDLREGLNYIGVLNRLLRTGEAGASQDQRAYIFVEKSWSRVNSSIDMEEALHGFKSYNDLSDNLATHITEVIGTWQSLLRYYPREDLVHQACVDIINRSDSTTLKRFIWFLDSVNRHGEFIDPRIIDLGKERLAKAYK